MAFGASIGMGSSSGKTSSTTPSWKPGVKNINAMNRLLWGEILGLYGDSPYGTPQFSPQPGGPQAFEPVNMPYRPGGYGSGRGMGRQPRLRDAVSDSGFPW